MADGIDVYTRYQTVNDWRAVRTAGKQFCYVKVSDGTTVKDHGNYGINGTAAGVVMGAYHYAQPGDPIRQANILCDQAERAGLTGLAPALDLESPFVANNVARDFAITFLRQVKARGHRPCLYANNSMLTALLGAVRNAVPDVVVWVARYGATPTVPWDVWQHADNGRVPGIAASSVDLNTGAIPYNIQKSAGEKSILDMSNTQLQATVGADGVYRYHCNLSNWDKVSGYYVSMGSGWGGCEFEVFVKKANDEYVATPAEMPSGSYGKVLKASLAKDDVHWLGLPSGAKSFSVTIKRQDNDTVPSVNLFTDGK